MKHYTEILTIDPNVRFGKPCVRGGRISVYDILGWMASGMSRKQILEDYPELSSEDINACLAYAADREHKHRIAS
jgi:uncharacterized protein (DUF433 family)